MHIKDETIKRRSVCCTLNEHDLNSILSEFVAKFTDFEIDPIKTKISVTFDKKDRVGTSGFEKQATITLINDIE